MKKTNTIVMMITFFIVITMLPIVSIAEEDYTAWYGDGSATEFTIKTVGELAYFATLVNGVYPGGDGTTSTAITFREKTVNLVDDINLADFNVTEDGDNDGAGWYPIGSYGSNASTRLYFYGTFNGNGHTIKNLKINRNKMFQGLFAYISGGNIKNLALENVNITGGQYTGGVAGALFDGGTIESVYVTGNVSGTAASIGGIVGDIYGTGSVVRNCYSTADVTGTSSNVGGIVGFGEAYSTIENCYTTGNIKGGNYIGGLSGTSNRNATIRNSAALNQYITTTGTSYGRIHGASAAINPILFNNFAWEGLLINNEKMPGVSDNKNGESKSADEIINNTETWSAFSEDYWLISAGSPPILKVFLSNENIEQIALYPEYLFGEPDEILPEQEWYYNRSEEDKAADIYRIGTAEELAYLAHVVHTQNNFSGKIIILTRDIDFADFDWSKETSELNKYQIHVNAVTPSYPYDGKGWIPIGRVHRQFRGAFDGNGYVIKNLYIDRPDLDRQGLFGVASVGSTIKNLGVINANVSGNGYTGIITGTAVHIENCFTTGIVSGGATGGIAGMSSNLSNSYSTASVTSRGGGGGGDACNGTGGVYGCNGGMADFLNLYSTGTVSGNGIGSFNWAPTTGRGLVALNNSVGSSRIGVSGDQYYDGRTLEYNYAWENVLVNGVKITNTNHWHIGTSTIEQVQGADVTADEIYYGTVWSADYANYPTDTWIIEEGKLPILQVFETRNDERGGVSVQPNAIPQYILDEVSTVSDLYPVEVGDSDNGKVTAIPAKAKAGDTVMLTVIPDSGYKLAFLFVDIDGVTVDMAGNVDEATNTVTFIMPGKEVVVAGLFEKIPAEEDAILEIRYELVSSAKAGLTDTDYEFRAIVTNRGGANAYRVSAEIDLANSPTNVKSVIKGSSLYFGDITAGNEASSTETFKVRINRTTVFDAALMKFKFNYNN